LKLDILTNAVLPMFFFLMSVTISFYRYFDGKTTNADGTVQYIKGQTSVKFTIDGVIKIFTVAVCDYI
jgi:P-type Ca2+ transporter type 2C